MNLKIKNISFFHVTVFFGLFFFASLFLPLKNVHAQLNLGGNSINWSGVWEGEPCSTTGGGPDGQIENNVCVVWPTLSANANSCYTFNGPFSVTNGISISEGSSLCPSATAAQWGDVVIDGQIPLAPAPLPASATNAGGTCGWLAKSSDYQLIIGDGYCNQHGNVGNINYPVHLASLILTPPFHFNTTGYTGAAATALQTAYQTALTNSIKKNGKLVFQVGSSIMSVPVGTPIAPTLYGTSNISGTVTVYGANFSQTGNTIQIQNSASTTVATISNLSFNYDGSTTQDAYITFPLPAALISGTYYVTATAYSGLTKSSNAIPLVVAGATPTISNIILGGNYILGYVNGGTPSYAPSNDIFIQGSGFVGTAGENTIKFFDSSGTTLITTSKNVSLTSISSTFYSTNPDTLVAAPIPQKIPPGTYDVEVDNTQGTFSNAFSLTIPSEAPTNLTAAFSTQQVGTSTTAQVVLNWAMPFMAGVNYFSVEASSSGSFTVIGTSSNESFTDLNAGLDTTLPIYRVRAEYTDGTYSPYSNIASSSPSNCYLVEGSGPDNIVFMRGQSAANLDTINQWLSLVNGLILNPFNTIEPYKTYFNQFSFYADMNDVSDSGFGGVIADSPTIRSNSSCGSTNKDYIFLEGNNKLYFAATNAAPVTGGFGKLNAATVTEININGSEFKGTSPYFLPVTIAHETGHAFGELNDEYITTNISPYAVNLNPMFNVGNNNDNCVVNPSIGFVDSINNQWYGDASSGTTLGCDYYKDQNGVGFYRPSINSIMNNNLENGGNEFNIISCGYVIAGILNNQGIPSVKAAAQQYWPQCYTMAQAGNVTGLSELPPRTSTPTISSSLKVNGVTTTNIYSGDPTITGTNFSTVSTNDIHLINTASSAEMYDITAPASPDGTHLSFIMPTGSSSIPLGTYTLEVGGFNSSYSSPITVTVVAPPISLNTSSLNATSTSLTWTSSLPSPTLYTLTETAPASTTILESSTWTSYNLSNLIPNTTYNLVLTALNKSTSLTSNLTFVTPAISLSAPILSASSTSSSTINFSWTPVANATNYTLLETSPASSTLFTTTSSTSYQLTKLTANSNYCVILVASNNTLGSISTAESSSTCVTTSSAPLLITISNTSATSTLFSWSGFFATSTYTLTETTPTKYQLYQGMNTSFQFSNMTPNTNYCVTLAALNGQNLATSSACTTTLGAIPTLTTSSFPASISLNWSDIDPSVAYYELIETSPASTTLISKAYPNLTSDNLTGLNQKTQYCFVVEAVNASGTVATSNPTCATPLAEVASVNDSNLGILAPAGDSLLAADEYILLQSQLNSINISIGLSPSNPTNVYLSWTYTPPPASSTSGLSSGGLGGTGTLPGPGGGVSNPTSSPQTFSLVRMIPSYTVLLTNSTNTNYIDTGLTPGTQYCYTIVFNLSTLISHPNSPTICATIPMVNDATTSTSVSILSPSYLLASVWSAVVNLVIGDSGLEMLIKKITENL